MEFAWVSTLWKPTLLWVRCVVPDIPAAALDFFVASLVWALAVACMLHAAMLVRFPEWHVGGVQLPLDSYQELGTNQCSLGNDAPLH